VKLQELLEAVYFSEAFAVDLKIALIFEEATA